ncbi:MAG TPA: alanine racemase [Methylophilaceae bacterium]|jgi:alanine racemase
MRPILATISRSALRHNLGVVKSSAPHSKVMAVIKANGYGHGVLSVAQGLDAADGFAVLELDKAIALREAGFKQVVLLLEGLFAEDEVAQAAKYNLSLVVHNFRQLEIIESVVLANPLDVFLKLNTGMNRLGFAPEDFTQARQRLADCANVAEITLMTHFATADEDVGIAAPFKLFQQTTAGFDYPRSLANSAAILRYPQTHMQWVRPGIMLYGATPVSGTAASSFGLKPVMSLASEVIAVQQLQVGDSVGYGNRFTASRKTRVGIVACGYADGYPRHAPNGTPIAVAGQLTQTIGRVSMDMLFADITDIPEANTGSTVELWGEQVPVDVVAEASGTVGYELLCALAPRVPVKVMA